MAARGHVQVIAGCMYSGKTDELLRLLRRAEIARQRILLVRPRLDDRTEPGTVRSRSGAAYHSKAVADAVDIEALAKDSWADVIAIEEAQFFPASLVGVVERLADAGRTVIVSGLNLDFRGRPFGPMPVLMAMADGVTSLSAICTVCGEEATRTQRLIDGRPAGADEPVVVVGGASPDQPTARHETYEARCRAHHELP
ncbi:MAG: thymidine kinase [Chloroflexi bacterium]|nr:thymidine kinase [Chloroflexota bacterium]